MILFFISISSLKTIIVRWTAISASSLTVSIWICLKCLSRPHSADSLSEEHVWCLPPGPGTCDVHIMCISRPLLSPRSPAGAGAGWRLSVFDVICYVMSQSFLSHSHLNQHLMKRRTSDWTERISIKDIKTLTGHWTLEELSSLSPSPNPLATIASPQEKLVNVNVKYFINRPDPN